jgi:CHAD domain-containing protein/adenylate cyclase class IV
MDSTIERELKLEPPEGFELPPLAGEGLDDRLFTSTYYDTPDRSLARAGITLRRRLENGVSRWQLKLPRGENTRSEIEALGGPAGPPEELLRLLKLHLRHGELEPVATLRTHRAGIRVEGRGRAVADVTLDEVDILDETAAATGRFSELEVELIDGDESDLRKLGRALRRAGARRSDGRAKVMRVLRLQKEAAPKRTAPASERIAYLLGRQLLALETHDPGVRMDDDPEDLHQFRVATRRTRAVIRATRPLLGDLLEPLAVELRWLGTVLGSVRDLDVLIEHLSREAASLGDDRHLAEPLLAGFARERKAERKKLATALDSERYLRLPDAFAEAIGRLQHEKVQSGLKRLAAAEFRKLRKAEAGLPRDPSDQQLHALRIRAKRARYAAELVGGERIGPYIAALKRVQDVIGEHQDAVVAEAAIRSHVVDGTALAAGRLIERERAHRLARRAAYPAVLAAALRRGRKAFA